MATWRLSADVPLRTTVAWGQFQTIAPIPWVWGRSVTVDPVPYDAGRTRFVVADHPISRVVSVLRAGEAESSFQHHNGIDATGHPVAFLDLGERLEDGDTLAAAIDGRIHPLTGALVESPADILWDILANLAGRGVEPADFDEFRAECRTLGYTVAGALTRTDQSLRAAIDERMVSVGARWSQAVNGYAVVQP